MFGCAFIIFIFVMGMLVDFIFIKGNPVVFDHHWVDYLIVGTLTFMAGRFLTLVEQFSKVRKQDIQHS